MFLFLEQLEKELFNITGIQLDSYNPEFLINRIKERMLSLGIERQSDYLERLKTFPGEAEILLHTIGINVSKFFRNPLIYEIFEHHILPNLLWRKTKEADKSIRIWSAGCACGEEPYSIAILLHSLLYNQLDDWQINIFGTDINSQSLTQAANGLYDTTRLSETKFGYLQSYFTPDGSKYRIKSTIRNMVNFSLEDLATKQRVAPAESIYGEFDLVFCRNVMIYFNEKTRKEILNKIVHTLCSNGLLVLGESEGLLSDEMVSFTEVDRKNRIFKKS